MTTEALNKTGKFFSEQDERFKISQKTNEGLASAKVGLMSLWGRAKTLVQKNPAQLDGQPGEQDAPVVQEEVKEPEPVAEAAIVEENQEEKKAAE